MWAAAAFPLRYADPMDITKMLDIAPGAVTLDGVRDVQHLFYLGRQEFLPHQLMVGRSEPGRLACEKGKARRLTYCCGRTGGEISRSRLSAVSKAYRLTFSS